MGKEYHVNLEKHINKMIEEKTISAEDAALYLFTDSVDEAIVHIREYAMKRLALKPKKTIKPWALLGERKL